MKNIIGIAAPFTVREIILNAGYDWLKGVLPHASIVLTILVVLAVAGIMWAKRP